jgi:hypothetical protein
MAAPIKPWLSATFSSPSGLDDAKDENINPIIIENNSK